MGFKRDIALGKQGEVLVTELFTKHGIKTVLNQDRKKLIEYDVQADMGSHNMYLEIKLDFYCARSGNIAIEFFNPKKGAPSGLTATQADIWVHMITCPQSVWFTSVKLLKEYVATNKPHKTITDGGDKNSSMYLYKKDIIFNDIFHRVDECETPDFLSIISNLMEKQICSD